EAAAVRFEAGRLLGFPARVIRPAELLVEPGELAAELAFAGHGLREARQLLARAREISRHQIHLRLKAPGLHRSLAGGGRDALAGVLEAPHPHIDGRQAQRRRRVARLRQALGVLEVRDGLLGPPEADERSGQPQMSLAGLHGAERRLRLAGIAVAGPVELAAGLVERGQLAELARVAR